MLEEKVTFSKIVFFLNKTISLFLVTRVRSHGYAQVVFNVVTKDMDALGYRIEAKHSSLNSQTKSENNETNYTNNLHS
jgi:hypothetical protein